MTHLEIGFAVAVRDADSWLRRAPEVAKEAVEQAVVIFGSKPPQNHISGALKGSPCLTYDRSCPVSEVKR